MESIRTDCLVIGAGLAGSAYALHAARAGLKVALISLSPGSTPVSPDWGTVFTTDGGMFFTVIPVLFWAHAAAPVEPSLPGCAATD